MSPGGPSFSSLCKCGHMKLVHRPGPCNVTQGCSCAGFVAAPIEHVGNPLLPFGASKKRDGARWVETG